MKRKLWRCALLLILTIGVCSSMLVFAEDDNQTVKTADNVEGTTYYISSSTGSDENDGLTEDTAWKTFAKLPSLELKAGDKILLKKGDTWIGDRIKLYSPTGTKENLVVLGAYGEGEKPSLSLFEDEVPKYSDEPLIEIINAENVVVDGLDIGFCGVGIDLSYELVTNKENVHIKNCHFHDIYGFYQLDKADITKYPHATSIVVTANVPIPGNSEPVLKGLYIDKCTTYDASSLYTYGTRVGSSGENVNGLYVTECIMENNGIYGIALCSMDGGYMDNCKIIDCGSRYAPMGSMGIMISGDNFTIMNSEICFQQRLEDNPDGGGIDFEHLTYDTDIINCYIHDNSGVGIMMYSSGADASHQNKRIRLIGNVFENNNQNVYKPGGAEIISVPLYSLVDGAIYNNRYMESENMFTMNMDASVDVQGNISYPEEQQGKVWPIYNFDDVRAYVIDGTPLPSLDEEPTTEEAMSSFISDYGNYFLGIAIGLFAVLIAFIVLLGNKKRKKSSTIAMLLVVSVISLLLPSTTIRAAENDAYHFAKMYGSEMNEWKYYWYDGYDSYVEMIYNEESGAWTGPDYLTTAIINKTSWHPFTSGYTVATFTCPKSGTVRIGTDTPVELTNVANTMDGTILAVMSDGELIGKPVQVTADNPIQEYDAVEMDVYEGQKISFYLHMNITNAGDSTTVSPYVEYTSYKDVEPTTPKADADTKTEEEKVLRTDIRPMNIEENTVFVISPVQMVIGAAPIIVIGVLILIFMMKKGKNKNEQN